MKIFYKNALIIIVIVSFFNCKQEVTSENLKQKQRQKIEMVTNYGTMIFELYNETPLHRDNFINLTNNGAYDGLLFHRVIDEFMIQAGDPDSRNAKTNDTLGNGDAPYIVGAEFNTELFHKKGVLAAARDDNPKKASSAMQFYIVHGKKFNDSLLDLAQIRNNKNKAQDYFSSKTVKIPILDSIQTALDQEDMDLYKSLMNRIYAMALTQNDFKPYSIPENQRVVYKSQGGTPHLDQNYTVFGELVQGFEVLDAIATAKTTSLDRPLKDVVIKAMRILK
ncbi:MAG: peptidylprolyl isomerase [Winogradskyella sp.]|nr:peptidylprolyl isomerase [Winogradskyella sp.]